MEDTSKQKILRLISEWEEEQLAFLVSLCNQNSFSHNKKGSDRVSALVIEKLKDIFPVHQIAHQEEVGDTHILKTIKKGKHIFLLGHADTVFPPDHAFQTCRQEGDWLCGPGTADMKGGLAVMVYALKALKQVRGKGFPDMAMILGADEEIGSITSRQIFEQESKQAQLCLAGECGGKKGEIVVSRNGKAGGRMEIRGRDSHVGSEKKEKASAILELAHKVIAFESLNGRFPGVRANVGYIEGGLGPATIPAYASFLFDLRWQKEEHHAQLIQMAEKIAATQNHPRCVSRVIFLNHRPAMPPTEKTDKYMSLLRQIAKELGQEVSSEHRYGTSDGNFFAAQGVPTLDGFGPIGLHDHTPQERILIPSLKSRTLLLASFLHDLSSHRLTAP